MMFTDFEPQPQARNGFANAAGDQRATMDKGVVFLPVVGLDEAEPALGVPPY
jgi:hypothetical protein